MKKLICALLFTCSLVLAAGVPKWHNPDVWRKRLRKDLLDKRVLSLLGEPAYIHRGYPTTRCYYGKPPFTEAPKKKSSISILTKQLRFPWDAYVMFHGKVNNKTKKPQRAAYYLYEWKEPVWSELSDFTAPKKTKQKPPRKLHKWEREVSWRKLTINMPWRTVDRILGPPQHEGVMQGRKRWYYGNVISCGYLVFNNEGLLYSWYEPFWPEVEANIYRTK